MPNLLNKRMVGEIEGFLKEAQDFIVVDFTGMSPQTTEEVRKRFRGNRIRMRVVKASLARIAAKNVGYGQSEKIFDGTSAVVYGGESIADVARAVRDLAKEKKLHAVKGVVVENKALDASQVLALAALPTRHELLGQLLGTIIAPLTGVLGGVDALLTATPGLTAAWEKKAGGN